MTFESVTEHDSNVTSKKTQSMRDATQTQNEFFPAGCLAALASEAKSGETTKILLYLMHTRSYPMSPFTQLLLKITNDLERREQRPPKPSALL